MLALSHPTGNTNVRAVLAALDRHGLLDTFYTTLGVNTDGWLQKVLPSGYRAKLRKRAYRVTSGRIVFHPLKELMRLAAKRASIDEVYIDLDAFVAKRISRAGKKLTGVYCYEDGALETFRAAKTAGLRCCYDLPIAYWETSQRLLWEEAERRPAWEPTLVGTRDSQAKLQRKTTELELADVIFCASKFVYDSLPARARETKRCVLAEFGSPKVSLHDGGRPAEDARRPLRMLFAGSMTQRKGLADLFDAVKLLKRAEVELIVLGTPIAPLEFYKNEFPHFRHEGPRPHGQVLELMRTCDVFCLPSLVEGRALVQQEALSCGLPLIVTPNAGGEDLIEEGRTGFLVPIRAPEKIAEKIAWFADHRDALPVMRDAARRKAAEYTWERYGEKIIAGIEAAG